MSTPSPRRKLPVNPSLEHLQKQAKRRAKENPALQLAAAQHQLAQEYGCQSWSELARVVATMAQRHDKPATDGKRYQPLPAAARAGTGQGDFTELRRLLRESEFTRHDLDQSLAHVLWYGSESTWEACKKMADELLDHGADPDGQYGSGGSGPIVFGAGECVRPDSLEWLIGKGADMTAPPLETKYGKTCVLSSILGTYVRGKNAAKHRYIDLLLQQGAYIPPEVTPAVLAIHRGDARQLAELLERDRSLLSGTYPAMPYGNIDLRGAGLLHCAVEFGETACVETLLTYGADINLKAEIRGGIGGQTPLFHAIASNREGNFPTLEYLVRKSGPTIDMSVRATWRRHGDVQPQPMTPLEFAEHAARTEDPQWRTKMAEEDALLRSLVRDSPGGG
jgi:hypothetical protein